MPATCRRHFQLSWRILLLATLTTLFCLQDNGRDMIVLMWQQEQLTNCPHLMGGGIWMAVSSLNFLKLFPGKFVVDVIVTSTSEALATKGVAKLTKGKFLCYIGLWFLIAPTFGFAKKYFWDLVSHNKHKHPCPFHLGKYMSKNCFNCITHELRFTTNNKPAFGFGKSDKWLQHGMQIWLWFCPILDPLSWWVHVNLLLNVYLSWLGLLTLQASSLW